MSEWSPTGDDLLLARLGEALLPSFDGPSADAVQAFRQTVAAHRPSSGRRRQSVWSKSRVAFAALLGTTTLGAGVAFAAGAPLPSPLRSVARGLGLPVDSPAVSAARNADDALSDQLNAVARGQGSKAAVATDASKLSKRLATLSPSERRKLGMTPNSLLAQARQVAPQTPVTTPRAGTGSMTTAPPSSPSTGGPASTLPLVTLPTLPPVTLPKITVPTIPTVTFTLPSFPTGSPITIPDLLDK
jgi:hypothetical protein